MKLRLLLTGPEVSMLRGATWGKSRLSAERELCIGGTLRADPEEPFYGEGHRERGGWLSSGTENQRHIQILSIPLHLAR